jgi:hypothetical protein
MDESAGDGSKSKVEPDPRLIGNAGAGNAGLEEK